MGKIMGIDYGAKRVGVALSDNTNTFAFPKTLWSNDERLLDRICYLCREEDVEEVVVGESQSFAMKDNPIAPRARAFAAEVRRRCGVRVVFEPEVLSTQQARRLAPKRQGVDVVAAAVILEAYLARKRGGTLEQYDVIE
ncbi:Holliday junction resolvase RuvX [Candidatus Parcubacteria bacterium]|nr:MAG: Holliday junction resolvase RuvX [Candidatus Parcubacteria bacterium]GIW68701.1 MAG: putative pre-16S rRNA nuclease [Candidatus Parcubacteria bacterium]